MKETIITTADALRLAVGVSTVELVIALVMMIVTIFVLKKFYDDLVGITKALDRETYQRYLMYTGRARPRPKDDGFDANKVRKDQYHVTSRDPKMYRKNR